MVDWMSLEEITRDADAFGKLMHVLLGLYVWEWFTSLGFDWQFITGKKPFRWPLIFYFLNRYCLLFALVGIAIALNVKVEVNCQALYTFNQVFGNAAIGLASINLSLRTIAVWSQSWWIIVPLVAIILGHWSLLLHGILLNAVWVPGQGCTITNTNASLLAATFIYTMSFDFLVLVLTAYKLFQPNSGRSKLVGLIFSDGLIYFAIAFLGNLLATVFMLLNLNPVMSIIANVPAAIASTIVACRVVRRLSKFTSAGAERFAASTQNSTLAFRSQTSRAPKLASSKVVMNDGVDVHVQMETFDSPPDKFAEYDAAGNRRTGDAYDPEAQQITDEFKRPPY
ncbi:hypothetical protein D9611_011944 [Ephemerocybe angulata]|uniref:Transmembrane protein n=1 Tax=Ephemerocybe angulata TaxID=980116 RepID=A0A8H5C4M7_9AGAR|nr:hypothetical protein D9611_011944 [Tulosesus angulatus]